MMYEQDMIMGHWSIWHWVIFVAAVALILYPTGQILKRIGFSPFWSVLAFIPILNVIGLWIVALVDWPRDRQ
jgi:hypothetical protein